MTLWNVMSILKLEIRLSEIAPAIEAFNRNRKAALEALSSEIRSAVSTTINELLKSTFFSGNPINPTTSETDTILSENTSLKALAASQSGHQKIEKGAFKAMWFPPMSGQIRD
jgi:hypothetical protein